MTPREGARSIETDRLLLTAFREDDFPHHLRWLNRPELAEILPIPQPVDADTARAIFDQILDLPIEQGAHFAVWLKRSRTLTGGVGLGQRDLSGNHAALSALIGEPELWGQGLATEATAALIEYGFTELSLRKLWLNHRGDNLAARRVAEKLGFVEVGRQRQHCRAGDGWTDWITMELFAPERRE